METQYEAAAGIRAGSGLRPSGQDNLYNPPSPPPPLGKELAPSASFGPSHRWIASLHKKKKLATSLVTVCCQ